MAGEQSRAVTASSYSVPIDFDPMSLCDRLGDGFTATSGAWVRTTKTFFDSFDWRLNDVGTVLLEERAGPQIEISWRPQASGRPLASLSGYELPRFVADLPPSPMRQRLTALLEMRALLPLVRVESKQRSCEVRDTREKVIARLVQETWTLASGQELPTQLRLEPVRGFERACRPLARALRRSADVSTQDRSLLLLALAAEGRHPGDYSSKLRLKFVPRMRSDFALRQILGQLLETLELNLPGTREDLDSEFLHDFRVSVRRCRSALGQLKGILPPEQAEPLRQELAWLGQATGPMRDLDVALLKFNDYRAALPEDHRSDIKPLQDFLERQKGRVHAKLCRDLRSRRFAKLVKDWRALAAHPADSAALDREDTPKAAMPIERLGAERIAKGYRRVLKDGGRIGPKTAAEALHDLRKDCKKLRYLIEFFRSLYQPADIRDAIKTLKDLQENLGDFQDLEVQQDQLRGYGREMSAAGLMSPATQAAISALVRQLESRQADARRAFAARFEDFSTKSHRKLFERLFAVAPKPGRKGKTRKAARQS